jgi:alpha/beta superfamily hydrolase
MGGDRVDNHRLAILLAEKANFSGISVVRFDYRGCGLSGGEFHEISISSKVNDSLAIIDFVTGCYHDEPFRLFLLGYSDGARVVHQVLKQTKHVCAFALWAPVVSSMSGTLPSPDRKRVVVDQTTREILFPMHGLYMGLNHLREASVDLGARDLLLHRMPKSFIFGTGDVFTDLFQRELKIQLTEYGDVAFYEIDGANHAFNRSEWSEDLVNRTVGWILQTCRKLDACASRR